MYICNYKSPQPKAKGKKAKQPRQIEDYLPGFLQYCDTNLEQYAAGVAAGSNPDWRIKEAILWALGNILDLVISHKQFKSKMEPTLHKHVLPEL